MINSQQGMSSSLQLYFYISYEYFQESIKILEAIGVFVERSEFNFNFVVCFAERHQLNILCRNFADGPQFSG